MIKSPSAFLCVLTATVAGFLALMAHPASGQTANDGDSSELTERFTFTLSPHRDYALIEIIKSLELHDEVRRSKELEEANVSGVSRILDLLRYIPIRLSASDGRDDFFTPYYLRPDFARLPAETHLFDPP